LISTSAFLFFAWLSLLSITCLLLLTKEGRSRNGNFNLRVALALRILVHQHSWALWNGRCM
jgi:hypothetical protein